VSIVAIAHHEEIRRAIMQALGELRLDDIVKGRLVAIKPNDTWATPQDTTGVTQGDTLQAVIQHVKRGNPRRIVVSGGAGAAETDEVFRYSGMMDAVKREGVEFHDHNRPPFTKVTLDYGPQREVVINSDVLQYETLISLAQLKLHETATVTLSMKNIAMSYPAADYYGHPRGSEKRPHHFFDDMHGFIVGMVKRFPIHLAIIVGHPAMIATGPLGGKAVETGLAIASRDCVAADAVGARLLGFEPQGVQHIYAAAKLGLGQASLIEIRGLSFDEAIRIFTKKAYGEELDFRHA
jgi:uncharacterized protein (DUF362 family)